MKSNIYALVTGASEGLGKFLAIECAKRNWNLVLVALPGTGLCGIAAHIQQRYRVTVLVIEKDLTTEEACMEVYEEVVGKNIRLKVLINNAGMGGTYNFDEYSTFYYSKLIALNVTAPTLLCRLFLHQLCENSPGYILNVSSLAGLMFLPRKQVYGGTKAFLLNFSRCLQKELKPSNVSVSVLCPGAMNTSWRLLMTNRFLGTWLGTQSVMEPAEVAAVAVSKMLKKQVLIIPGFLNRFFVACNRILPAVIKDYLQQYQLKKISMPDAVTVQHSFSMPTRIAI